jgi:AraC family transcriptional regulator, regulatory protein of adaptative response / DNA-3-methyladenine glycosylase II
MVILDDEQCYRAAQSRDSRFDGCFITAVKTTGIYCRPSCPAMTPKRHNVEFFVTAAAAQQHGYRACKRCRPDASPGSPEWNVRADVVGRAMRLIADGLVDREGVGGLATRLSYSERQINRLLTTELGAGPLALARAQRAQTARTLIETTSMPITQIAFAAGFSSVRQFNDTIREVFASSPTDLRGSRHTTTGGGTLSLRLAYRAPFHAESIFGFLGDRAVPGIETWDGATYRRSLRLNHGNAVVAVSPGPDGPGANAVMCTLHLDNVADAQAAVQRCRRMLDLDADPVTVESHFENDPILAPLVRKRPGLRSPGHPDGVELLTRAVLGQQVSVKGARTLAARMVAAIGEPLAVAVEGVTHTFPSAAAIAGCTTTDFAMPTARARALINACEELASGRLVIDAGSDRDHIGGQLESLPGIGPWTASYVALRALGDPDVFLPTDLGVRNALRAIGVDPHPKAAARLAESWRPWRSYALHHLWASL